MRVLKYRVNDNTIIWIEPLEPMFDENVKEGLRCTEYLRALTILNRVWLKIPRAARKFLVNLS